MKEEPGEFALFESYMAVIQNSVGTNIFRNLYFKTDGEVVDVLNNGDLSCAVFVTSVLKLFNLCPEVCTTVSETIDSLLASGWLEIDKPRDGCILVWESHPGDDGKNHRHIGFSTGQNLAISNNWQNKCPIVHNHAYRGLGIERVLWHNSLVQ